MYKFILVVWLITPDNSAIYDTFETEQACLQKKEQVKKALDQAGSLLKAECRVRFTSVKKD